MLKRTIEEEEEEPKKSNKAKSWTREPRGTGGEERVGI